MRLIASGGLAAAAAAATVVAAPADAVCLHDGELYAKTSLAQEYRESRWVVRAKVLSARDFHNAAYDSSTKYPIAVLRSFKGPTPSRMTYFTWRDSGGFYLDRGAERDIGGEYLLFLIPPSRGRRPPPPTGIVEINYNCGQSRPWGEVSKTEQRELERWSGARR